MDYTMDYTMNYTMDILKEIKCDIHNGHNLTEEQMNYINNNISKDDLIEIIIIYNLALKRLGGWRLKINN